MFRPTGLSKKKLDVLDAEREAAQKAEMAARDEARKGAYTGRMRMDGMMQDLQRPTQLGAAKGSRSRREEFKFEDDDGEQEANNDEIDNQIDQISAGVSMLHGAARAIGDELEDQIKQADRLTAKVRVPQRSQSSDLQLLTRRRARSPTTRSGTTTASFYGPPACRSRGASRKKETSGLFTCLAG